VGACLAVVLADASASGFAFTITGLSAPVTERSLSLQQATVRFDLRYAHSQRPAVDRFLARFPHRIRQWMNPVMGTRRPPVEAGGPAASASRLGVAAPLGVSTVLVVPGAEPDNRNHQPDEFIRPAQIDRHLRALQRVLSTLNGKGAL
jgi:acetylornithine deacetylase/succinyl-diaminopimelate desuccinylase-like protein